MICEHNVEWIQRQDYAGQDWKCAGCGMTMPAYAMVLFRKVAEVKALLQNAQEKK